MTDSNFSAVHKSAVILAAGKGTRMKSELPKVLHTLNGKALVEYVLDVAIASQVQKAIIVVGYKAEQVKEHLQKYIASHKQLQVEFVVQEPQLGTGHAVQVCNELIPQDGSTVVLLGDVPLLRSETVDQAFQYAHKNFLDALVLGMRMDDPAGYGRIVRDSQGVLLKICEEKDADLETKKINEVNSGIFVFNNKALKKHLFDLKSNNAQNEFYITDFIEIFRQEHLKVDALTFNDASQFVGINSVEQLLQVESSLSNGAVA